MLSQDMSVDLKLLLFISTFEVGGAERSLIALANAFDSLGLSVKIAVIDGNGPLREDINPTIQIIELGTGRGRRSIHRLRTAIKEVRPDVVLSFLTVSNMVSGLVGHLTWKDRPVLIGTEHSYFSDINDRGSRTFVEFLSYQALARLGYRRLDHLIAVSHGVRDRIVRDRLVDSDRVSVIPTPFTPPAVTETSQSKSDNHHLATDIRLLAVGRLDPLKDYPTLLRAMRLLLDADVEVHLDILGEGPERRDLTNLLNELNLSSKVILHGNVRDPERWYETCDVFVMSSKREGHPLVLVEALFYGCRIVSTDCLSGPREILAGGTFGALVPVGDHEALAIEIVKALKEEPNPQLLRARALDYQTSEIAAKYLHLITRLCNER